MTQVATLSELTGGSSSGAPNFPPVKPRWLGPATTLMVVLAHVGVAAFLMTTAIEKITPLESINMDLVPEGDMFESEQVEATDEVVPPEEMEQPDLAIPLPEVMTPDAPPIPVKKKEVVEPKRRVVEHKEVAQAKEHREAQDRHRIGMAGGRGTGSLSQAGYKALLAGAIRRHVPSTSSLGEGSASCSFHVSSGGGMTGISCSGSSGAHASLLRSAIAATHAPPPPGGGFFAAQSVHFR
jgi:protein TonB